MKREARVDERAHVDAALGEQRERGHEGAASRADEGDLVDDEAGDVERSSAAVGALEDDRAARPHGAARQLQPLGVARALDGHVRLTRGQAALGGGGDAAGGEQRELARVTADHRERASGERERLGHEVAQLPVAHHDDAVAGADPDLLPHLEGGGQGLGEDGDVVRDAIRHLVQVRHRQREALGEGAVAAADAEHGAPLAVGPAAGPARRAHAARRVDLTHHPAARPRLRARRRLDAAHELVARDPRERVVPPRELQVGVADPRHEDPHARLARGRLRPRQVVAQPDRLFLQPQPAHERRLC